MRGHVPQGLQVDPPLPACFHKSTYEPNLCVGSITFKIKIFIKKEFVIILTRHPITPLFEGRVISFTLMLATLFV